MILMEDIVREGHPALRKVAEEVTFPLETDEKKLCADLLEYVINSQIDEICERYGLRPGIGLAAPQVNVSKRIFALAYRRRRKETAQH